MATKEWRPCCGICRAEMPARQPNEPYRCASCSADWDGSELTDSEVKVNDYIKMMLKLKAHRETCGDADESGITDQLDVAWNELDGEEIELVEQELRKVWPMEEDKR